MQTHGPVIVESRGGSIEVALIRTVGRCIRFICQGELDHVSAGCGSVGSGHIRYAELVHKFVKTIFRVEFQVELYLPTPDIAAVLY